MATTLYVFSSEDAKTAAMENDSVKYNAANTFASISAAVNEAIKSTKNITIEIAEGDYTENISYGNKKYIVDEKEYVGGISFKAADGAKVNITGQFWVNSGASNIKDISFDGLNIECVAKANGYYTPIGIHANAVVTATGISVTNCTLTSVATGDHVGTEGIAFGWSVNVDDAVISGNTITADCGIYTEGAKVSNATITNNTITGRDTVPDLIPPANATGWAGIYLTEVGEGVVISGNTVQDTVFAPVRLKAGNGAVLTDNTFINTGATGGKAYIITSGSVISGNTVDGEALTFEAYSGNTIFVCAGLAGEDGDTVIIDGKAYTKGSNVFADLNAANRKAVTANATVVIAEDTEYTTGVFDNIADNTDEAYWGPVSPAENVTTVQIDGSVAASIAAVINNKKATVSSTGSLKGVEHVTVTGENGELLVAGEVTTNNLRTALGASITVSGKAFLNGVTVGETYWGTSAKKSVITFDGAEVEYSGQGGGDSDPLQFDVFAGNALNIINESTVKSSASRYKLTINVEANAAFNVESGSSVTAENINNSGNVKVDGATLSVAGTVTNNGTITVSGESTVIGSFTGNAIIAEDAVLSDFALTGTATLAAQGDTSFVGENTINYLWVAGETEDGAATVTVEKDAVLTVKAVDGPYGVGIVNVGGTEKTEFNTYFGDYTNTAAGKLDVQGTLNTSAVGVTNNGELTVSGILTTTDNFNVGKDADSTAAAGKVTITESGSVTSIFTNLAGQVDVAGDWTVKGAVGEHASAGIMTVEKDGIVNLSGSITSNRGVTVAEGGELNIAGGTFEFVNIHGKDSAFSNVLTNNGTIKVSGASTINGGTVDDVVQAANFTGTGVAYLTGAELDANTNITGTGVFKAVSGNNTITDSKLTVQALHVGDKSESSYMDKTNGSSVTVGGSAFVDVNGTDEDGSFGGWIGTRWRGTNEYSDFAETNTARYKLKVTENAIAVFDYLHVAADGELYVDSKNTTYDPEADSNPYDYAFYTNRLLVNGKADFVDTNARLLSLHVSNDNPMTGDAAGELTLSGTKMNVMYYDGKGTSIKVCNNGILNVTDDSELTLHGNMEVYENATVNLTGSTFNLLNATYGNDTVYGDITNAGTITIDGTSQLKANSYTGTGTITIDAADFSGYKKVIDLNGTESLKDKVTFIDKADDVTVIYGADGDVTLTDADMSTIYVDASYTGETGKYLGDGKYLGVNAFDSLTSIGYTNQSLNVSDDTEKIILAAGNEIPYGDLNVDKDIIIETTGDGVAQIGGFDTDKTNDPAIANKVTIAAGAKVDVTGYTVLRPEDELHIDGELTFDNNNAVYAKSTIQVNKTGILTFKNKNIQNTVNPLTVYGVLRVDNSYSENDGVINVKLVGNEYATSKGSLIVDGKDGKGIVDIDAPSVAFGGGYHQGWGAAGEGSVEIINGGVVKTSAICFRNGENCTITLNNGTFGFYTNAADKSSKDWSNIKTIHSTAGDIGVFNDGIITATNGSKIDISGRSFTNSGTISIDNSTFIATEISNTGTFTVSGESTLNIASLTGNALSVVGTTTLTDSTIGGNVYAGYSYTNDADLTIKGSFKANILIIGNKSENYTDGTVHTLNINTGDKVAEFGTLNIRTTTDASIENSTVKSGDLYVRGSLEVSDSTLDQNTTIEGGTGHWAVYEDDDSTKTASLVIKNSTLTNTSSSQAINYLIVGSNSNGENNADSNAYVSLENSSLAVNTLYLQGAEAFQKNYVELTDGSSITTNEIWIGDYASLSVTDSEVTATNVTNNGTFTVSGESTLDIASLDSESSALVLDSADVTASSIKGKKAYINIKGDNTYDGTMDAYWIKVGYTDGETVNAGSLSFSKDASVKSAVLQIGEGSSLTYGSESESTANAFGVSELYAEEGSTLTIQNVDATSNIPVLFAQGNVVIDNADINGNDLVLGNSQGNASLKIKDSTVTLGGASNAVVILGDAVGGELTLENSNVTVKQIGPGASWKDTIPDVLTIGYKEGAATVNINENSTLDIKYGAAINANSKVNVNGGTFIVANTVTNNGTFTVSGESTLKIGSFTGEITLADDAVISSSSKITGTGTINVLDDATIYWNTVSDVAITVGDNLEFAGIEFSNGAVIYDGTITLNEGADLVINGSSVLWNDEKTAGTVLNTENNKIYDITVGTENITVSETEDVYVNDLSMTLTGITQGDGYNFTVDAAAAGGKDAYTWSVAVKDLTTGETTTYDGLTFELDGTISKADVTVTVTDAYGMQVSELKQLVVKDVTAPEFAVSADTVNPAKSAAVTFSGIADNFGADAVKIQYNNNGTWEEVSEFVVNANGTYEFRAIDAAGNISATQSLKFENIDNEAPVLIVTAPEGWSNTDVKPEVTVTDANSATVWFAKEGGEFAEYTADSVISESGTYVFYAVDSLGNKSAEQGIEINIDKVAPTIEIAADVTASTNGNVTLTATVSDGKVEYFNGTDWVEGSSFAATENGTYQFRVTDEANNVTTKEFVVENIDREAPTMEIAADVTALTNGNVTLTATVSDGKVEYFNGTDWVEGSSFAATENGTYQFRVTDAAGNVTAKDFMVENIDTAAPVIEDAAVKVDNGNIVLTWSAADALSGLDKVTVAVNGAEAVEVTGNEFIFTPETYGEFNFVLTATDKAGNTVTAEKSITTAEKVTDKVTVNDKTTAEDLENLKDSYVVMDSGKSDIKVQGGTADAPLKVEVQGFDKAGDKDDSSNVNHVTVGNNTSLDVHDNIANLGNVKVGNNASLQVLVSNQDETLAGIDKKQTIKVGKNSEFVVHGNLELGKGNNQIKIGQNSVLAADSIVLGEGNNKINIGKNAVAKTEKDITLENGKNQIKIGNEATFQAENINYGTGNDKLTIGKDADVKTGNINLGEGKNQIKIGNEADVTAGNITARSANDKLTVGKDADVFFAEIDLGAGNDTFNIGTDSDVHTGNILTGAGNDKLVIGKDAYLHAEGLKIDMGEGKDTLNIKKNGQLFVDSLAGIETIKAAKGAELHITSQIDLEGIKGSWKNLEIFHELDDIADFADGVLYGNETDLISFDEAQTASFDGDLAGLNVEFSNDGVIWQDLAIGTEVTFTQLRVSAEGLKADEKKEYSLTKATLA